MTASLKVAGQRVFQDRRVVDVDTTVETAEPRFRFSWTGKSGFKQPEPARSPRVAVASREDGGPGPLPQERLPLEIFLRPLAGGLTP
jgi:hypothetical protein